MLDTLTAALPTMTTAPPPPESAPLRVGLIGHGLSGAWFHGPLLEAADDFRIAVVSTSRPDTLSLRRDAPRSAADPLAVCAADDVDLVVIASPNETHFALGRAALCAGKHVVIDKPFVLSVAEADELIAVARARALTFCVFHNRRLDGDFLSVERVLGGEELGEVVLFESRWDRFRTAAARGWRNGSAPGAGLLWDLGPHLIDQALRLFGQPDAWTGDMAAQRGGADDYFELTLRYGRMRCLLSASTTVAAARPRFAVHGTGGSYVTRGLDPTEAALRRGEKPDDPEFRSRLPAIHAQRIDAGGLSHPHLIEAGHWERFYPEVAHAIRSGAAASSDAVHAVAPIAMIEACHRTPR